MTRIVTGNTIGNWRFSNNCERNTLNKQKQSKKYKTKNQKKQNKKGETQIFLL